MPQCKNIPKGERACYYKGDENTPRGKGWCAKYCDGETKKGTNGKMYTSSGSRWVKKTSVSRSRKTSPRMELDDEKRQEGRLFEFLGENPEYKRDMIKMILGLCKRNDIGYGGKEMLYLMKQSPTELGTIYRTLKSDSESGDNIEHLSELIEDLEKDD